MRAIDFACRFLIKVAADDMSPGARLMLMCLAAGLDMAEDIARMTGIYASSCTQLLRMLERRGFVRCVSREYGIYELTAAGKDRIRQLLDFLPVTSSPCEKDT